MNELKGFTLAEALLTLFVCGVFVLLPVLALEKLTDAWKKSFFFETFEQRVLTMQQLAIVSGYGSQIDFSNNKQILFRWFGHSIPAIGQLSVPVGLTVHKGTRASRRQVINFSAGSGRASELAAVEIKDTETGQQVVYTFQLGSGRYRKT